jgi:hypothetical protein
MEVHVSKGRYRVDYTVFNTKADPRAEGSRNFALNVDYVTAKRMVDHIWQDGTMYFTPARIETVTVTKELTI